jgi:WD40 repeat protein
MSGWPSALKSEFVDARDLAGTGEVAKATAGFAEPFNWNSTSAASEDSTARVWNAETSLPVTPILHHTKHVLMASFCPDDRTILTASADGTAKVWDAATGEPLTVGFTQAGAVWHVQ